jgi:hypothetical protein
MPSLTIPLIATAACVAFVAYWAAELACASLAPTERRQTVFAIIGVSAGVVLAWVVVLDVRGWVL